MCEYMGVRVIKWRKRDRDVDRQSKTESTEFAVVSVYLRVSESVCVSVCM